MRYGDWRKGTGKKRMTDKVDRAPELCAEFHLEIQVKHDFLSHFLMGYSPAMIWEEIKKSMSMRSLCLKVINNSVQESHDTRSLRVKKVHIL